MKKNGGDHEKEFARILLKWNQEKNVRQMPWKGEKDPYRIWLSEIILQQTRVEQGLEYYKSFIKTFPVVQKLAAATDEKVFKLWEGLGYYTRCRNLLVTARYITRELKGIFPSNYEAILSLKGVGPYTAAAISSFAFNLPHAVVDGNVFRVLARIFAIDSPIDSTNGKKTFSDLADRLLDKTQPGQYNQAIMDFGAVICKPVAPLCSHCPFKETCLAYRYDKVGLLPVKEKKIRIRKRWFYYFVLQYQNDTAIQQRIEKDIWQNLYEFPVIESANEMPVKKIIQLAEKNNWVSKNSYEMISISFLYTQQLSHQLIAGQFIKLQLKRKPRKNNWQWLSRTQIYDKAFPRFINQYLEEEMQKRELL